ncbi:HEAT repeat domain-containing protein [Hymenobacter busanensis]|uniref:HEAT repeat domain-containing protein n=1 Tax=Hymenobacter busanensis TaxID=2607656 RepID=A0A7L4ZV05_9BACT|nr:zf-HC2 domain-containing protein [Hymenobacter busanensis]KAA9339220.1 HEAT repeat domain-containing protein [Hymenobacter busanensis]QHJ07018.1 HEAT repeat domain-containing protein [Hymenobacter busanensis]
MEAKFINCEQVREGLMDWLANEMPADEAQAVEAHLAQCPDCRREQAAVWQLWQAMGNLPVPEPSEQMRPRFYSMLAEFQAAEQRKQQWSVAALVQKLRDWWQPAYAMRLAYGLALLVVGLAAGYGLKARVDAPGAATQQPLAAVPAPAENAQQAQLLALLANPSAVQRLRAVSYAEEVAPTNERVVGALLSTLYQDPNVNVRLATLEVLAGLADDPTVRQGLVRALAQQDSPLVQSAMADVMVQLQERRSVRGLRKLLRQDNLNEQVKTKIEQSIQSLSHDRSAPADASTPSTYHENNDHTDSALDTSVAA